MNVFIEVLIMGYENQIQALFFCPFFTLPFLRTALIIHTKSFFRLDTMAAQSPRLVILLLGRTA